MAISEMSKI